MKTIINYEKFKYISLFTFFVLGLYYYVNSGRITEPMDNLKKSYRCPNMLIEKDGAYYLYNSKMAIVPGVNPIQFDSLEDYDEFIQWQNGQGIHCPILYLQYSTDTQNNDLLQVKSSIFENQGGLPSEKSNTLLDPKSDEYYEENKMLDATKDTNTKQKYNTNMFQGIDVQNQNIGLDTPLDKLYHEGEEKSANPMDTKWGGKEYTKAAVDSGKYENRYVYRSSPMNS
jgi:hypothetical protein